MSKNLRPFSHNQKSWARIHRNAAKPETLSKIKRGAQWIRGFQHSQGPIFRKNKDIILAPPDALYKYVSADSAREILCDARLRWVSPALVDNPWFFGYEAELGFDHLAVNKAMLNTAVAMIFARDLPKGNREHPLYKAIVRWRSEDRFDNETEAYDALSELLAPTPETLEQKLNNIRSAWQETVANARTLSFSENPKILQAWQHQANNYKGLVLRFNTAEQFESAHPVEYTNQRLHLTTVREQVHDLVGIQKATVEESFASMLLSNSKQMAYEKEWRCIKIFDEEDLDCGEDLEDWYMDESFATESLGAVYFGFRMPDYEVREIAQLLNTNYPGTNLYMSKRVDEHFDIEFEKVNFEDLIQVNNTEGDGSGHSRAVGE